MAKAYVFLADGFEDIEALATVDILRRCGVETTTVSVEVGLTVKSAGGVPVTADKLFSSATEEKCDMLILPGGGGHVRFKKHDALLKLLKEYNANGKYISAICAAPTVLAMVGILDGKKAVCYPGMEAGLKGAIVVKDRVVTDGNVTTAIGPAATFDFAFRLVEILESKAVSDKVKGDMIFEQ